MFGHCQSYPAIIQTLSSTTSPSRKRLYVEEFQETRKPIEEAYSSEEYVSDSSEGAYESESSDVHLAYETSEVSKLTAVFRKRRKDLFIYLFIDSYNVQGREQ